MPKLMDWFSVFDSASEMVKPIIPDLKPARLARTLQIEQSERQRQAEQTQRSVERSAFRLPSLESSIQINANVAMSLADRIAVTGMTGTGKTTWVKELLLRMRAWYGGVPVNILDTKGYGEYDAMATRLEIGLTLPLSARVGEIMVWRPGIDDFDTYDLFFLRIMAQGQPCIVLADEMVNLGRGTPDSYPVNYTRMLKQGRFAKIMLISMTQEVAGMPRNLYAQTTHAVSFHLLNEYDKRRIARLMGLPAEMSLADPPLPYGFFYRRVDRPSPVYQYRGWQEFFRF